MSKYTRCIESITYRPETRYTMTLEMSKLETMCCEECGVTFLDSIGSGLCPKCDYTDNYGDVYSCHCCQEQYIHLHPDEEVCRNCQE